MPSYLEQKYVKQLVIIDDASKKCSYKSLVKKYQEICKEKDIDFVYIKNSNNMGAPYCRNLGIKNASEKFILWGEDDLYLQNDYLEILMPLVNEHTAACGEIIYDVELGESSESLNRKIMQQQNVDKPLFDTKLLEGYFRHEVKETIEIPFAHAILLVPKSAYDNISYYEDYKKNGYREETDAQVQMVERGLKILYTSKSRCFHLKRKEEDKGGQHSNGFLTYELYKIRNNNIFINRHYDFFKEKYKVKSKLTLKFYFTKMTANEILIYYLGLIYHLLIRKGKKNV